MPGADITICIPTWQAAPFIGRTLGCARAQTHAAVRILVSVDPCTDETEAICRAIAREDPRIEVIAPEERLGWSANANFLLSRVDTENFFFYFHDDIIDPDYVAALLSALEERPDAMSAHCDIERFGDRQEIQSGRACDGGGAERLIHYLACDIRGLMLRALIRTEIAERVRFPLIGGDGLWRVLPFEVNLVAAGPALHVARPLYRRWLRPGSMTATWHARTKEELIEGQRECARLCLEVVEGAEASPEQKQVLRFCLALRMLFRTRKAELDLGWSELLDAASISPLVADISIPTELDALAPELRTDILAVYGQLLWFEGMHALRSGDEKSSAPKLRTALSFDPGRRVPTSVARLLAESAEASGGAASDAPVSTACE